MHRGFSSQIPLGPITRRSHREANNFSGIAITHGPSSSLDLPRSHGIFTSIQTAYFKVRLRKSGREHPYLLTGCPNDRLAVKPTLVGGFPMTTCRKISS